MIYVAGAVDVSVVVVVVVSVTAAGAVDGATADVVGCFSSWQRRLLPRYFCCSSYCFCCRCVGCYYDCCL